MRTVNVTISGRRLMMHNIRLANPTDEFVVEMKKITAKSARKKSADDYKELSRLEFQGGLYFDDKLGPYISGDMIESFMVECFRRRRLGNVAEAGIVATDDAFPLSYEGPRTRAGLWDDKRFVDYRGVGVQASRVMRTRPIFKNGWKLSFGLMIQDDSISLKDMRELIEEGGKFIGLAERRPKYGTFEVESFREVKS